MDDEALHEAFVRVKEKFEGHDKKREAFYRLRDGFCAMIQSCAKNVRVVLYVDDILDMPIKVDVGKKQNRLRITIKTNGTVSYQWTKQTWAKIFTDAKENFESLAKRMAVLFRSIGESPGAIGQEKRLAITEK